MSKKEKYDLECDCYNDNEGGYYVNLSYGIKIYLCPACMMSVSQSVMGQIAINTFSQEVSKQLQEGEEDNGNRQA